MVTKKTLEQKVKGLFNRLVGKLSSLGGIAIETNTQTETIGVDCGLDGGIVSQTGNVLFSKAMPTIKVAGRRELDTDKILTLFLGANEIVIEEQFIIATQGNKGNFTTGKNYGILLALAITAVGRENVYIIHPNIWQSGYCFPPKKTKADHISQAKRLGLNTTHDGIADAFLLLKYHNKIQKIKRRRKNV
jgi:hypothetical protein